jgi:hypothetical protein
MLEKNDAMLMANRLLFSLLIIISAGFADEICAQQKEQPKPYQLTSANIDHCKTNKDEVQTRIKLKLVISNPFQDHTLIHSLTKKGLTSIQIYKNTDDVKAKKLLSGEHIFRVGAFQLNKPIAKMEAIDLFSFFTMLGPSGSYEEVFDYTNTVPRQEYSAFGGSYFLKLLYEAYFPDEVEDLIEERMKPFNPVFLRGFLSEPILVEINDFNSLPRCE